MSLLFENKEASMKRSYDKPILTKREQLVIITAQVFVSPIYYPT